MNDISSKKSPSTQHRRNLPCNRIHCSASSFCETLFSTPDAKSNHRYRKYPAAVAYLRSDLDELITSFHYKSEDQSRRVRTTNAVERRPKGRRLTKPAWTVSRSPSSFMK
jgi:transposase-like protein